MVEGRDGRDVRALDASLLIDASARDLDAAPLPSDTADVQPERDAASGLGSPEAPAEPEDAGHPAPMEIPLGDAATAAPLDADVERPALPDARVGCAGDTFEGSFEGAVDGLLVDLTLRGRMTFQVLPSAERESAIVDGLLRGESTEGHAFAARLDATWDCDARSLSSGLIAEGTITYDAGAPLAVPLSGTFAGGAVAGSLELRGEWSVTTLLAARATGTFTVLPR